MRSTLINTEVPIIKVQPSVRYSALHPELFIRELGKKFDSGSIRIIDENKERYISFNINITVDKCETFLGETNRVIRQLQFSNSVRFIVSSLESLSRNLVGTNGMACKECRSEVELRHIDESYITHGTC